MDGRTFETLKYQEIGYCRIVDLSGALDDQREASRFSELAEACDRIAWDDEARAVVFVYDEAWFGLQEPGYARHGNPESLSPAASVSRLAQPVIAAVRGDATGFGLETVLACDIRIGTENAHFGFPQIRQGRIPSNGGTQRLPRLIGCSKAMEMILTGEWIDSDEAMRVGLLNRVVSHDMLMNTAMEMARDMASKSPLSLSYAKEALYGGGNLSLDQGLRMELDLYLLLFTTSDRTEGIQAFKEKRKPRFGGS